jgi:Raf kinase inhibitor-like YbhB/YbcL family protein
MKTRFFMLVLFLTIFVPWVGLAGDSKFAPPPPSSTPAISQMVQLEPQVASAWEHEFRLTSTTFENDQLIPSSMVFNGQLGSICTGGNESPELSWTPAVRGTRSYAVVLFDITANFTHWGTFNITPSVTELSAGAGAAGSGPGQQILNDTFNFGYSGPCPPPGLVPGGIHRYVFTVYALDKELDLPPSVDFPPTGAALYRAMLGHVIDPAVSLAFSVALTQLPVLRGAE